MMIARITMRGMLIIGIHNIVLSEAMIDISNQTTTKDRSSHDENYNVTKMIEQQEQSTLSDTSNDIYESLDQTLLSFLSESSFGRQKVIELMIDQYVSPTTPEDNMTDKLDNAIEAMSFIETDGKPVQVMGYPFLFVGSVGASLNHKALQDMGITNVINWSSSARCNVFDDVEYMCIKGVRNESSMQKHTDKLEKAVDYIESVRLAGGKAMSHCWYGMNRSVTLLVAYLMKYEGMTAADANDLIMKSRPQASPYWEVLQEYSNNYLSSINKNSSASLSQSPPSSGLRSRNNSKSVTTDTDKKIPKVQWEDEDQS